MTSTLSSNSYELRDWFEDIEEASKQRLGLGISKWQVSPVTRGINFLGFHLAAPQARCASDQSSAQNERSSDT